MLPLTLIPAAILTFATIIGVIGLRRFSNKIRISFNVVCFVVISLYFERLGLFPVFAPLSGHLNPNALWLRGIGGAWWFLAARILVAVLTHLFNGNRLSPPTRLFSDLLSAVIYIATGLIVVNSVFALPISSVVATSGLVAIVLGLALQNTLADVFAGIAVGIEAPFAVGDRIQIGEKIEGVVVQVNWRSIRLQTDGNDIAIIPNSIVAKAELLNRSYPTQRRAASVEIRCPEHALPEKVIETLLHATLLCPDILRTPEPSAVVTKLGPKMNHFSVSFSVAETKHLGAMKDLLLRASRRQLHYGGFLDLDREAEAASLNISGDAMNTHRLLRDVVLFECLSEEEMAVLEAHLNPERLEPGEVLFAQGAGDASLYIIASGVIEIRKKSSGDVQVLGCIGAGEYIGEIGLLTGAAHAATATAKTHCQIYRLPHDALGPLLKSKAELAAAFEKSARRGLDILHRKVVAKAVPSVGSAGQLLARIRAFFGAT